ncbi:adhesion G protein-coupled receptor L1-like [Argopecten irradians]|uniref:adhesion G protein-coupled receptor L1-like n=1 Tax=Argopecten irradians TaxID=31199 RepID=UPI0037213EEC
MNTDMMTTSMVSLVLRGSLFLIALCRGLEVLYVCENTVRILRCKTGILIHGARYGRFDRVTCPHTQMESIGCGTDVKEQIRSICDAQTTCLISASNNLFVDPCPEKYSYLEVNFTCVEHPYDSTSSTFQIPESTAHVTTETGSVDTTTNFEYREVKNTLEQNHAESLLMTSTVHSQTECAIECSATLCISFSYNSLTRECRLYGTEICYRDDGVTSSDVKVFTKIIQPDSGTLINYNGTHC